MKKISIITINYNNCIGLQKTIASVINQTFTDYEYIIIDGGSTDGSVDIIRKYADKIDYWVSEPDRGIYHAMNKGILKATGEYCNFMNSGDCFHQNSVLKDIHSQIINEDIIWGNTNYISSSKCWNTKFAIDDPVTLSSLNAFGSINHQATFIRKQLFESELYDENLKIFSDFKFFFHKIILENCNVKRVITTIVDFDTTGISTSPTFQKIAQIERKQILSEYIPERVLSDYEKFDRNHSPILKLLPQLNKTYRFHQFIYHFIAYMIKVHEFIKSIKKNITSLRTAPRT